MKQGFEAEVSVLPLASVVLFPGTVLPLQVVSSTLCDLINDALKADGTVAVAMLKSETGRRLREQDVLGMPLHDVGCLCRIIHTERRANGRMDVLLQGLRRVALLEEVPSTRTYRRFRLRLLAAPPKKPSTPPPPPWCACTAAYLA